MAKSIQNRYNPDYVSPPGETLLETLDVMGLSPADLAERTSSSHQTIVEMIEGKSAFTSEMTQTLEKVLNVPANFWSNRENSYQEYVGRQEELF